MAIAASIISAYTNKAFISSVFIGELGILGEVKDCIGLNIRIKEARKLGFKNIFTYKTLDNIKR